VINDFSFTNEAGENVTDSILGQSGVYYLLFVKDLENLPAKFREDLEIAREARDAGIPFYIITGQKALVVNKFKELGAAGNPIPVFTCDATAIKTAARADMVLYRMKGPVVENKWGWADFDEVEVR
jgi:hypothetical protein